MKQIPNIISGLRLLMVGIFIWLFVKANYVACLVTYIVAFFSDLLDGYLARRNNWITDVGKVLDPLADKLMLLSAVGCFFARGWLPAYMAIIIFAKELIMVVGGIVLFKHSVVVYADWYGKFASGFFSASVILTLLKNFEPFKFIGMFNLIAFGIAIVLAVIALIHYARLNVFGKLKKSE